MKLSRGGKVEIMMAMEIERQESRDSLGSHCKRQ